MSTKVLPFSRNHLPMWRTRWLGIAYMPSWIQVSIITASMISIFAVYGLYRFGTLTAALDYAEGCRILVDEHVKLLGDVPQTTKLTVHVKLTNFATRPVRFLGSSASCGCVMITEMPEVLENGAVQTVKVIIKTPDHLTSFSESATLYTDYLSQPELVVNILGRTVKP